MDVVSPQRKPYDGLATIYDFVMRHVDYVEWSGYVHKLLTKFGNKPQSLIDLACGTGNNTPVSYTHLTLPTIYSV